MNSFYDNLLKIGDKYIDFNNNGIIVETPDIKIVNNQQNNKNIMKAFVFSEYENIIEEEKGKFNSIEEIKNVNGIGDKKYEELKTLISIE